MAWREKSISDPWDALRILPWSCVQAPGLWKEGPIQSEEEHRTGWRDVGVGGRLGSLFNLGVRHFFFLIFFKGNTQVLIYSDGISLSRSPKVCSLGPGAAAFHAWLTSVQPYTEIFCPNIHKANYFGKRESTIKYKTQLYST